MASQSKTKDMSNKNDRYTHFWFSPSQLDLIHQQVDKDDYCTIKGRKRQFTEALTSNSKTEPPAHGLWHDYTYLGYGAFRSG